LEFNPRFEDDCESVDLGRRHRHRVDRRASVGLGAWALVLRQVVLMYFPAAALWWRADWGDPI
jgi:hypothetical protein